MTGSMLGVADCLCGAVHIKATSMSKHVGACHCGMCRKWGGGPFMEVDCGTDVTFTGEDNISVFDSSKWAERGFCRQCGSHLFYRLKDNGLYMIPVGLFADNGFVFDHQVFVDKKPSYYRFANKTKDMTEQQVFDLYEP
jgi:hypothetical protein